MIKISYISKLDEKTSNNLEAIYKYSYDKWFDGQIEDKPTKLGIVRLLINELHESMVEEGEING